MKVLLIDDEPLARKLLRSYCERTEGLELLGECENGFEAVQKIDEYKPDLIFLDIQMPKLNGFEVLELVSHLPKVVFTTAFDEYAVKAFEVNALDYLLKPFLYDRFEQALQKAKSGGKSFEIEKLDASVLAEEHSRIVIKDGDKINILPLHELVHIEAYDDYVKIYSEKERFVKKQTMAYYEKRLPAKYFVRIHRSHIIAIDRIQRIENAEKGRYTLRLTTGQSLPISRSAYPRLKAQLGW